MIEEYGRTRNPVARWIQEDTGDSVLRLSIHTQGEKGETGDRKKREKIEVEMNEDTLDIPVWEKEVPASPRNVRESIEQKFLLDMPDDFFDFWNLCSELNQEKTEEAFADVGLMLVGPYDVLSGKLDKLKHRQLSNYLCHWRYYFDPPEFMTVLASRENEYHIGYYRDDCFQFPVFVASMSSLQPGRICPMAQNIFGAVYSYLSSKLEKEELQKDSLTERRLREVERYARKQRHTLGLRTPALGKRQRLVVGRCFHGAGVAVDSEELMERRVLPVSEVELRRILQAVTEAETEGERAKRLGILEVLVKIVRREISRGNAAIGLEFGHNLFSFGGGEIFHKYILQVLGESYDRLFREPFLDILQAHLKNRRRGNNMSILNV
ncbi:histone PARylation factor 1-like isoform X2 [Penaeus chinensis]|uniref:histone PARylation factor 1-like isoform X2 n=1 Tax=Penaeus chinensis TaxID=139456 RepID=UPI001FB8468E|nr:histone PARylation factor 1-like isoform X2 [Penaeus chinensis]